MKETLSVLVVCTGNICRSPTGEAVLRYRVEKRGLADRIRVASAGTHDYHVGECPDGRSIKHARKRGYDLTALRARQVAPSDFDRHHWILAMDESNLRALEAMRPRRYEGHLGLLLDFVPELGVREVPDPYYGGRDGFDRVLDLAEAASEALVRHLHAELGED